jgi:serine/threonine protein kinase
MEILPEKLQEQYEKDVQREIKILNLVNGSENVVKLYEILEETGNKIIIKNRSPNNLFGNGYIHNLHKSIYQEETYLEL